MTAGPLAVLRPLREGDAEAVARWQAKAVVLAGLPGSLSDPLDSTDRRQKMVLTKPRRDEPAGLIPVALDDPEPGWATVALLAVAAQEQRDLAALGIALLEASLRGQGKHIRAAAPPDAGLALYFWLRLGYRPAISGGRLWMIRDLDA